MFGVPLMCGSVQIVPPPPGVPLPPGSLVSYSPALCEWLSQVASDGRVFDANGKLIGRIQIRKRELKEGGPTPSLQENKLPPLSPSPSPSPSASAAVAAPEPLGQVQRTPLVQIR